MAIIPPDQFIAEYEASLPPGMRTLHERLSAGRPLMPVQETEEESVGFWENAFRGTQEEFGEIGAGLANAFSQEELAADLRKFVDAGYEERYGWDDVEQAWDEGKWGGIARQVLGFAAEQGVKSLPWMASAFHPALFVGLTASSIGRIAEQRAKNNNRKNITPEDILASVAPGVAAMYMERLGTQRLLGRAGTLNPLARGMGGPQATRRGIVGEAGKRLVTEATTEALQEGVEELGGTVGTEAGVDLTQVGRVMLAGTVAGGTIGAGVGTLAGTPETVRRIQNRMEARRREEAAPVVDSDEQAALDEAQPTPTPTPTPARAAETELELSPEEAYGRTPESVVAADEAAALDATGGATTPQTATPEGPELGEAPTQTEAENRLEEATIRERSGLEVPVGTAPTPTGVAPETIAASTPEQAAVETTSAAVPTGVAPEPAVAPTPEQAAVETTSAAVPTEVAPETIAAPTPAPATWNELQSQLKAINTQRRRYAKDLGLAYESIPLGNKQTAPGNIQRAQADLDAMTARIEARTPSAARLIADEDPTVAWNPLVRSLQVIADRGVGSPQAQQNVQLVAQTLGSLGARRRDPVTSQQLAEAVAEISPQIQELAGVDTSSARPFSEVVNDLVRAANTMREKGAPEIARAPTPALTPAPAPALAPAATAPAQTTPVTGTPTPTPTRTAPSSTAGALEFLQKDVQQQVQEAEAAAPPVKEGETRRASSEQRKKFQEAMRGVVASIDNLRRLVPNLPEGFRVELSKLRSRASTAQDPNRNESVPEMRRIAEEFTDLQKTIAEFATRLEGVRKRSGATPSRGPAQPAQKREKKPTVTLKKKRRGKPESPMERRTPDPLREIDQEMRDAVASVPEPDVPPVVDASTVEHTVASIASDIRSRNITADGVLDRLIQALDGLGSTDVARLQPVLRMLRGQGLRNVRVLPTRSAYVYGEYLPDQDAITLNVRPELVRDPAEFIQTTAHELIHAATAYRMQRNSGATQRLESLRQIMETARLRETGQSELDYLDNPGLSDVYEFVAEGLTNPQFQQQLDAVDAPRLTGFTAQVRSLWDAFVDTVRRALNRPPREGSILSQFLRDSAMLFGERGARPDIVEMRALRRTAMPRRVVDPRTGRQMRTLFPQQMPFGRPIPTDVRRRLSNKGLDTRNWTRKQWLRVINSVDIIRYNAKYFRSGTRSVLEEYRKAVDAQSGTMKFRQAQSSELIQDFDRAKKKHGQAVQHMSDLAFQGTMMGQFPDLPWDHPKNVEARDQIHYSRRTGLAAAHDAAHRQWKQNVAPYKDVVKLYHDTQAALEKSYDDQRYAALSLIGHQLQIDPEAWAILTTLPIKGWEAKLATAKPLINDDKKYDRIVKYVASFDRRVPGPYFPLRRQGQFVTYGTMRVTEEYDSQADAEARASEIRTQYPGSFIVMPEAKDTGKIQLRAKVRFMELFELQSQAEERATELRRDPNFEEVATGKKENAVLPQDTPLSSLLQIAEQKDYTPEVRDAMREAVISLLPEVRHLQSQLARKYVAGYDTDLYTVLAQHLTVANQHIASLFHAPEIQMLTKEIKGLIRAAEKDGRPERVRMREVIDELALRRDSASKIAQENSPFWDRMRQAVFLDYLAGASFLALNATQPLMVTMPELQGTYGIKGATRAMATALRQITGELPLPKVHRLFSEPSVLVPGMIKKLERGTHPRSKQHAALLREALRRDRLSSTQHEEMAIVAHMSTHWFGSRWDRFARMASFPGQHIELHNRMLTLIASYEAEMARSNDPDVAVEAAMRITEDTNFNYTMWNRSRIFHSSIGRLFGVFKTYGISMYSNMVRYMHTMVKGESPEAKRQAALSLGYFLAAHTAVGGILNGLIVEPIRIAIAGAGLLFDDEDDFTEVWDDLPLYAARVADDWFDDPDHAKLFMHGFFPAIGERTSLGSLLFFHLPDANDSAHEIWQRMLTGLGGAPVATVTDFFKALEKAQRTGEVNDYLSMVPFKLVQDLRKAYSLDQRGLQDSYGNPIVKPEEFGYLDKMMQAAGFTPTRVADAYMARSVKYEQEKPAKERAKELRNRYYRATRQERSGVFEDIMRFNRANPHMMITVSSLLKGLQRRRKQALLTRHGAYYDSPIERYYYQGQVPRYLRQ